MTTDKEILFFDDASSIGESEAFTNYRSDNLTIQVSGDFDSAEIYIEGKVDSEGSWMTISLIDFKSLELLEKIEAEGEFQCCITGMKYIRATIDSFTGTNVRVFGRTTY